MIQEIIKLNGIGMLHDSVAHDPVPLSEAVAIYAENGRGKSTFSCLLRSMSDNDCTEVRARRTLRQEGEPYAEILIDGVKHTLSGGSWDRTCEGMLVFDDHFVEEHVSVGSLLGAKHLQNLLGFVLEKEAPETAEGIEDALEDFRSGVNSRLRALASDVELATLVRNDTGESPWAYYTLRMLGGEVPVVTAEPTSPSFSTLLSPGDRRQLALAFFFCALDGDPGLPSKTVVFDDPSRGLDRRRKTRLAEALMGFIGRPQVIVLSHDAEFVQMMRDRGCAQVLEIARSGVYCTFGDCDIDAILAADYTDRFVETEGFMTGGHPTF